MTDLLDSFLVRSALAGVGVAVAAAQLGCFVVWRRMAFFGDATAHASVLGIALALSLDLPVFLGAAVVALAMATTVSRLSGRGFATDTLLGVLSHSALAFGLVAVALLTSVRIDLQSYLFGDILAVNRTDLVVIWGGAALVTALLAWRRDAMLTATLNPDLAYAAGLNPRREDLVLTLALALVVAVAIKVVGALLIGALLIIPAATARPFAKNPEGMVLMAAGIGIFASLGGLALSYEIDAPTGPTIVCTAALLFALSSAFAAVRR